MGCSSLSKPPSTSGGSDGIALTQTLKVYRSQLKNGLKLLILPDSTSPTFAFHTWFNVGSRDEHPQKTGLAHLFEHMMFKQTKNLKDGEFDQILSRAGVQGLNAFTGWDYTAYIQELPKDKLELIIRLESDRMKNLIVDEKAYRTEIEVVQNERRFRNENSPEGTMYQALFEMAFKKHSYRWPIIGYQEHLNAMSVEDALEFYQTYYSPKHATIIIAGDVDVERTRNLIEKYYGEYENNKTPDQLVEIHKEPEQKRPRRKIIRLPMQVEKLMMGFPIGGVSVSETPKLEVLEAILTLGHSSRLERALVETGIASSVGSGALHAKDPTLFLFSANMQINKKAAVAGQVILKELQKLRTQKVSEKELQRAKNMVKFAFYNRLSSNSSRARFIGKYEITMGSFEAGLELYQAIDQVTAEDILEVANRYFEPQKRTTIIGKTKTP